MPCTPDGVANVYLVPEELPNRINNLLIKNRKRRFGFSFAPNLVITCRFSKPNVPTNIRLWSTLMRETPNLVPIFLQFSKL
jgi:hypothetical protein